MECAFLTSWNVTLLLSTVETVDVSKNKVEVCKTIINWTSWILTVLALAMRTKHFVHIHFYYGTRLGRKEGKDKNIPEYELDRTY